MLVRPRRLTFCGRRGIKDKKLHEEIYKHHMGNHLDIAMDAVANLNSRWDEVDRQLHSEW